MCLPRLVFNHHTHSTVGSSFPMGVVLYPLFFLANFHFKLPVRYTGNKIIALDVKLGKKNLQPEKRKKRS